MSHEYKPTLVYWLACLATHNNPDTVAEMLPIVNQYLPSGSGFDAGTVFDVEKSTDTKLVFHTSYHHMSQHGYYTRWTEHKITVTPTFSGFDIKVWGRDFYDIKEFIASCFDNILGEKVGDNLIRRYREITQANCA